MRKTKAEKEEIKKLCERVKEVRELLAEFGVTLHGIDPGVTGSIAGQTGRGPGYWGEQLSLDKRAWDWLKPLLEELREKRGKDERRYGTLAWTVGDVLSLAEDRRIKMTEEEAEAFLIRNQKYLVERLAEVGWDALATYLHMDQMEKKRQKGLRRKK